jgi:hypothetical protein
MAARVRPFQVPPSRELGRKKEELRRLLRIAAQIFLALSPRSSAPKK